MLRWITTYIDGNVIEWENNSLDEEMTEVDTRMAAKPANLRPIIKTGDVLMDKAEMKTSLANKPEDTQQENSKN